MVCHISKVVRFNGLVTKIEGNTNNNNLIEIFRTLVTKIYKNLKPFFLHWNEDIVIQTRNH